MPVSMDAVVTVQCFAVNKNDDLAMLLTRPGDVDIVAAPDSINASVSDLHPRQISREISSVCCLPSN